MIPQPDLAANLVLSVKNTFLEVRERDADAALGGAAQRRTMSCPPDIGSVHEFMELEHRQPRRAVTLPAMAVSRGQAAVMEEQKTMQTHAVASMGTVNTAGWDSAVGPSGADSLTTLTIKNIPSRLLPEQLRACIVEQGYGSSLALFHMPIKKDSFTNKGYAFITFKDTETAHRFLREMNRFVIPGRQSTRELLVEPAKLQGVERNYEHLSSVMQVSPNTPMGGHSRRAMAARSNCSDMALASWVVPTDTSASQRGPLPSQAAAPFRARAKRCNLRDRPAAAAAMKA